MHELLGIDDYDELLGHPVVGTSWEGFTIENVIDAVADGVSCHYFRTAAGAEIDLVILPRIGRPIAIEIKRSLSPNVSRGFHIACDDIRAEQRDVLYPGEEGYPLDSKTRVIGLNSLRQQLAEGLP